jgi:V8-like Glu-specific endopeptidase
VLSLSYLKAQSDACNKGCHVTTFWNTAFFGVFMSWSNLNGFLISSPGYPVYELEHGRQWKTDIATDWNSTELKWSLQKLKFNKNVI